MIIQPGTPRQQPSSVRRSSRLTDVLELAMKDEDDGL